MGRLVFVAGALLLSLLVTPGEAAAAWWPFSVDESNVLNAAGKYRSASAAFDWDGDGTEWQTCRCGPGNPTPAFDADWICGTYRASATDDTATDYSAGDAPGQPDQCRFHGERIWDDITDDIAALDPLLDDGSSVDWPEGIYVQRGALITDSDLCWNSSEKAYTQACKVDSGSVNVSAIVMRHDRESFNGAGADTNGETDLERSGTWVVKDSGLRSAWFTESAIYTIVPPTFCMGYGRSQLSGYCGLSYADPVRSMDVLLSVARGECADDHDTGTPQTSGDTDGECDHDGTTDRVFKNMETPEILCIDDDDGYVTAEMGVGTRWLITGQTLHGSLNRVTARVESVGAACGSSNDGLLVTFGGTQWLNDSSVTNFATPIPFGIYGTESADAAEAAAAGSVLGPIDESRINGSMSISGFTFSHQNYRGDGTCTDGTQAACDEGPVLTISSGYNNLIEGNAFVHLNTAYGSGGGLNVEPGPSNVSIKKNTFRFSVGASAIDVSSSTQIEDNIFSDNTVNAFTNSAGSEAPTYLVRVQGAYYRFLRNVFERNIVYRPGTGYDDSAIVELSGSYGSFAENTMLLTPSGCVTVTSGARFVSIDKNTFSCGDLSNSDNDEIGFPIKINPGTIGAPSEAISISGNIFLNGGRITGTTDTPPLLPEGMILIKEGGLNIVDGEIGPLGIRIIQNTASLATADSIFVVVRGTDDPDNARIYIDGNSLSQGQLAGSMAITPGASLFDLDIGSNGGTASDGIGLTTCGTNLVGGSYVQAVSGECAAAY